MQVHLNNVTNPVEEMLGFKRVKSKPEYYTIHAMELSPTEFVDYTGPVGIFESEPEPQEFLSEMKYSHESIE